MIFPSQIFIEGCICKVTALNINRPYPRVNILSKYAGMCWGCIFTEVFKASTSNINRPKVSVNILFAMHFFLVIYTYIPAALYHHQPLSPRKVMHYQYSKICKNIWSRGAFYIRGVEGALSLKFLMWPFWITDFYWASIFLFHFICVASIAMYVSFVSFVPSLPYIYQCNQCNHKHKKLWWPSNTVRQKYSEISWN